MAPECPQARSDRPAALAAPEAVFAIPNFLRTLEWPVWGSGRRRNERARWAAPVQAESRHARGTRAGVVRRATNAPSNRRPTMEMSFRNLERIVRGFANHRRIQLMEMLASKPDLDLAALA